MLKGIPAILPPELLKILAEMGHGDELVVDVAGRVIHKKNDPDFAMEFRRSDKEIKIVSEGGLLNYIEKYNSLDI